MKDKLDGREKFIIRMPVGMRNRIRRCAERSGRSMNAEVLQALEKAYPVESEIEETLLEIGRCYIAEIESEDADEIMKIQQEISDLYSVLQYERKKEMGCYDPLEFSEHD